jgi:chromosome segregation ATPase
MAPVSARQEKVRAALDSVGTAFGFALAEKNRLSLDEMRMLEPRIAAALAEVEEWEADREQDERIIANYQQQAARVIADELARMTTAYMKACDRAGAAEAERDQALRDVETVGQDLDAANARCDRLAEARANLAESNAMLHRSAVGNRDARVAAEAERDKAIHAHDLAAQDWKQAEAERDRLAGLLVEHHALGVMDGLGAGDDCPICARAALAADEVKT